MSARNRFQLGIGESLPSSGRLDISKLLPTDPARIHSLVERTGSARIGTDCGYNHGESAQIRPFEMIFAIYGFSHKQGPLGSALCQGGSARTTLSVHI